MTNKKWLTFAGFLTGCIYQKNHPDCPFRRFKHMDQYQRLKFLSSVNDRQAESLMKLCFHRKEECKPGMILKHESNWDLTMISRET